MHNVINNYHSSNILPFILTAEQGIAVRLMEKQCLTPSPPKFQDMHNPDILPFETVYYSSREFVTTLFWPTLQSDNNAFMDIRVA